MSSLNILFKGALIFLFLVAGCANNPPQAKEKVVAKINNFELTVEDLKEEANPLLLKKYAASASSKQKFQVLEELITKEVLLQEAQRLNLDKQKSFMKEIGGYWEQALMKSLVNRKLQEFSSLIQVNSQDILEEYGRLKRRIQAQVIVFNDQPDAVTLSKIAWDSAADWYNSNELPQKLEYVLFSLAPGQVSLPIEYNNSWVVMRSINEEPRQIEALERLKPQIIKDVIRKKKEFLMDNWILGLRKKANVRVYPEILNTVDLK